MGLIKAIGGAVGGVMADQWKEYFYCDALPNEVLVRKGQREQAEEAAIPRVKITSSAKVL